MVKIDTCQC